MLSGEKVLITGPAGRIAFGLARSLAPDNEVWGIARFSDPATREQVEALGVTTRTLDIADAEFGDLPTDFTYLLHIAADFSADDYDRALRVNAEATGFVLEHCRTAKAALVMSTVTIVQAAPGPVACLPRGRSARRRDGAAVSAVLGLEDRPGGGGALLRRARSTCRSPSLACAPRTAIRAASRCGTSTRSRPASRFGPAGIPCPTARSTTTTSARSSSRCSMLRACRRRS